MVRRDDRMATITKHHRVRTDKEAYASREEARQAGDDYLAALEPRYQAGRSIKVFKVIRGVWPGRMVYHYEVYLAW